MTDLNQTKTVQPEDIFKFKFLTNAAISPDGEKIVYSVFTTDLEKEKDFVTLFLTDLKTGTTRQLTNGISRDTSPAWSPDSRTIAFLSKRTEKPQLFTISVDGGEAKQLTFMEQGVGGGAAWSPDGSVIAFTAGPKQPGDLKKPYRVTRNVYRFDGLGYLDQAVQDIYIINASGGEPKQLTDDRNMNTNPMWSPDGQEILFLCSMKPDTHRFQPSLRVVNLRSEMRDLCEQWGTAEAAAWLPNGRQIAFLGQHYGLPIGSKNDLWVINASGGEPECRTARYEFHIGAGTRSEYPTEAGMIIKLDDSGKYAYTSTQEAGTEQVVRVALEGKDEVTSLLNGDRSCSLLDVGKTLIVYSIANFNQPPELFTAELTGRKETQLTQLNQSLLDSFNLPTTEHLLFKSVDGEQVEGWISLPPVGKAPYPTILYIHGGPHSAFGCNFSLDFQMLGGAGFAVLFINHRASTGYGDKFATAIKGDWGNLDYHDLMAGVDYAIEKGFADPERLGCCGLSGGGNLSCWIVGHTDRFKAAVPENPVTNWNSFYGVSDIGVYFSLEELGGYPHEIPEIYRKCSPITYAYECKTPTLLVQGEADYRCPAEQSEQFYTVLKANGCTVEMVRLPESPHGGSINGPVPIRKAQNEALLDWMTRYVLG